MLSFLLAAALFHQGRCHQPPIAIPSLPKDTNPVPNNLQSFSIEFSYFPDHAGNKTHPKEFSKNLLESLGKITDVPPIVRVGGTTQYGCTSIVPRSAIEINTSLRGHPIYIPDQEENIKLIFENPDDDQPEEVKY